MTTEKRVELDRVIQRGYRHGLHEFLAEVDLDSLKHSNDRWESSHAKQSALDRKTDELLRIGVNIALRTPAPHIQIHMHAARKAGATPEEIMEVVDRVSRWVGNAAQHIGLEAWRATFRPDLPPIERVAELR